MPEFGPVLGDLPLLKLSNKRLAKLSPDGCWEHGRQRLHNWIRQAWMEHARTGVDVWAWLKVIASRSYVARVQADGDEVSVRELQAAMDEVTRECGLVCFGFFLESEARHLMVEGTPGPLLTGILSEVSTSELGYTNRFMYLGMLEQLVSAYRECFDREPHPHASG